MKIEIGRFHHPCKDVLVSRERYERRATGRIIESVATGLDWTWVTDSDEQYDLLFCPGCGEKLPQTVAEASAMVGYSTLSSKTDIPITGGVP